jgi:hypothetical protein
MALNILIDEFDGDPSEVYDLTQAEIKKREIPGVEFGESTEKRSKGWFVRKEKAPMLVINDDMLRIKLLAYQYGRSFHVSTRHYWLHEGLVEADRAGNLAFLEEVRAGAFSETVDRSVRSALAIHLEKRQKPVPPSLNPKDVFYKREAQTGKDE